MKKWSQNKGKWGKHGAFTYNYIYDVFCDLKLLASLQNFKSTCMGVLFLIKLQVVNCNCSEGKHSCRCLKKKQHFLNNTFQSYYDLFSG